MKKIITKTFSFLILRFVFAVIDGIKQNRGGRLKAESSAVSGGGGGGGGGDGNDVTR